VTRRCHDKAAAICKKCEAELRAQEERQKRDYKLDQERQAKQQAYAAKLAEIEDEISHQKRLIKDQDEEQARQNALAQRKQDLLNLKEKGTGAPKAPVEPPSTLQRPITPQNSEGSRPQATTPSVPAASSDTSDPTSDDGAPAQSDAQPDWNESEARDDWLEQKELWGAENEALDSLMSMIGLESVKEQFLAIKDKIDTLVRQDVPLKEKDWVRLCSAIRAPAKPRWPDCTQSSWLTLAPFLEITSSKAPGLLLRTMGCLHVKRTLTRY
jgi:hypothetical protein